MQKASKPNRRPYLFMLRSDSQESRRMSAKAIRELGNPVVAQHGSAALEVLATESEADIIFRLGAFSAYSKRAFSKESLEKLSKSQQNIAAVWNGRFTSRFKELKKARQSKLGKAWGEKGFEEPAPFTLIEPSKFRARLKKLIDSGQLPKTSKAVKTIFPKGVKIDYSKFKPTDIAIIESSLTEVLKNPGLAYHAARLWPYLKPQERIIIGSLQMYPAVLNLLADLFAEDSCWEMHGEISIGIVFVESSRSGGPTFTAGERADLYNEIIGGLSYLAAEHPSNNLSWVYDTQYVKIDVANQGNVSSADFDYDTYWIFPGMEQVEYHGNTYDGSSDGIDEYRNDMRARNFSEHAVVFFLTPYGTSWHAYSLGRSTIVMSEHGNDWGGWELDGMNITAAHEMCHKFGAPDEYTSGTSSACSTCGGENGCDNIPNGNCGSCCLPGQGCIMKAHEPYMCEYTRGQIGWSDIFVELYTADVGSAGTDDTVWLDIGDKAYELDSAEINDRERGDRQGYAIWDGGNLSRNDIKRILIRKDDDGWCGGWKLKRVKVYHQGDVICDQSPNKWIEDRDLWWVGCVADNDIVHTLQVKVTTADVRWAGTDDDVTLQLAGFSWDLDTASDDFERGDTNTFNLDPKTGLYVSDINSITIRKSSDGASGGWKLKGVQLIVNGSTIYNNQSINKWLEDDDRVWSDGI